MVRSKAPSTKKEIRGVDFKKHRRKLGRKLPPPKNTTNTEIKSKAIILPEQSVASDKAGVALSKKGQSLKELLQQTSHHNVKVRRDSLIGVREILLKDPRELKDHKLAIIEKLRERINDDDKTVRDTLYQLFKLIILRGCKEENQGALVSLSVTYIFNAMTHLALDVRLMALKFFDLVIQNFPSAFSSYAEKVLENYMDILQKIHFHVEDKSKLKTVLSGLLRCLSLLPSNKNGTDTSDHITNETIVLHAFKMETHNDPTDHVKMSGKLKDLLQLLVTCFNGLISVVHSQRALDSHTFDCMLCVLQSVDLVVQNFVHRVGKYPEGLSSPMSFSATKTSMQDQDLLFPSLDKLFAVFPMRPVDCLSVKEDQRYFIFNIIISQIYFSFRQWICPSLGLPYVFLDFIVDVLPKAQNIVFPMLLFSGLTAVIHLLVCWVLIVKMDLGIIGAALANDVSYFVNAGFLGLYVVFSSACEKTWTGFSTESLCEIWSFLKFGVPSTLMVCLEYASLELVVLLSGLLPKPKLETSVLSISLNTSWLVYMVSFGLGSTISTRVANELGAGQPKAAKLALFVMAIISLLEGLFVTALTFMMRNVWGTLYSNETEVINYIAKMMPWIALFNLFNGFQCVLSGSARGCGWQKICAFINLVAYYFVGLPAAAILAFHFSYRGMGLWIGVMFGLTIQVIVLFIINICTDWEKEAARAVFRVTT